MPEAYALPLTVREILDLLPIEGAEPADLDDADDGLATGLADRQLPEVAAEVEVLVHRHLGVERRALREVPDVAAHLEVILRRRNRAPSPYRR